MKSFTYLGLTFEPVRNTTPKESENLSAYIAPYAESPGNFNYDDFYKAAGASCVDIYRLNGDLVMPCDATLMKFRDPDLPEHYCREMNRLLPASCSASFSMLLSVMDETGKEGFYPTPADLATEMAQEIDVETCCHILEPSAGKGDLAEAIRKRGKFRRGSANMDIDCIEINPDLRAILKEKGFRVVHDDFLTFDTFKQYDAILMNPPFKDGDRHLMKALDLVSENGGQVVCLLNAETLRNPCTNYRKELKKRLDERDAKIVYFQDRFAAAERKADVTVAMVSVKFPPVQRCSDFYDRMEKADEQAHARPVDDVEDLAPADFIERICRQFRIEVSAGMELIRQYEALKPYILREIPDPAIGKTPYSSGPILTLGISNNYLAESMRYDGVVNQYVRLTRYKYWQAFFQNDEFTKNLTSDMRKEWEHRIDDLSNYDFTPFNLKTVLVEMNAQIFQGVEDSILKIFEQLTAQHSWYPECQNNIHYYNGWAHNKAHKINTKVIIPSYGVFPDWKWSSDTFRVHEAYNHLADIERCFNFLDGHTTADIDLYSVLNAANAAGQTKNIHCKFFDVTFYKKGTTHIKFTNQRLLDKFNIYCSQKKGWLPPFYGKRRYEDMGAEEKAVVDDFQGKESYEEVMRNPAYYLPDSASLLSLPCAV